MKLFAFLIIAVFTAATTALAVLDGVTWTNTDTGEIHQASTSTYHPLPSRRAAMSAVKALAIDHIYDDTPTISTTKNPTLTALGDRSTSTPIVYTTKRDVLAASQPDYIYALRIKDQTPENVGLLRNGPLYNQVYQALSVLCPQGEAYCHLWNDQSRKEADRYRTFGVDYLGAGSELEHGGLMWVWLERGHHHSEQIRRLLIGTIASTIEGSIHPDNCRNVDPKVCNIPNHVWIETKGGDVLDVRFHSNTPTWGKFQCASSLQQVINSLRGVNIEWASALGGDAVVVNCQ